MSEKTEVTVLLKSVYLNFEIKDYCEKSHRSDSISVMDLIYVESMDWILDATDVIDPHFIP